MNEQFTGVSALPPGAPGTLCVRDENADPPDAPWVCQFNEYPGTVGWKSGYRFFRDLPLDPAVTDDECDAAERDGDPLTTCQRIFDSNRKDMFRYVLFAHALGVPQADCLYDDQTAPEASLLGFPNVDCMAAAGPDHDPSYHVPVTNSGVSDFPGADILIALGGFDDAQGLPVGSLFMQASTLMHELGHGFWRRHGGEADNPNCSPSYLSVMNYLFQLRGLLDNAGIPHLDFSGQTLPPFNETMLSDPFDVGVLGWPYRTGWYAPQGIGSQATKHCDGSPLLVQLEDPMFRVDSPNVMAALDWDGDLNNSVMSQDINFDGVPNAALSGPNDWLRIRLNQLGSRRSVGGWFFAGDGVYMGPMSLDMGRGDFGRGDFGRGDFGRGDFGRGDFGRGDLGLGDFGRGDFGLGAVGEPLGELSFDIAAAAGFTPPNGLTANVVGNLDNCSGLSPSVCHRIQLSWTAPNVGTVSEYRAFRSAGAVEPVRVVGVVIPTPEGFSLIDTEKLPDLVMFTYYVQAVFDDGTRSGPSNFVTITAVNDAPVAFADNYTTNVGTPLNVPNAEDVGVLDNDTDVDSLSLAAVLPVVSGPSHGTVTLNADGSFIYDPEGFVGVAEFTYRADNGTWSRDPGVTMSSNSNPVTVKIDVKDTLPPVVTLTIPLPNGRLGSGYFVTSPVTVTVTATDPSGVVSIACDNASLDSHDGLGTVAARASFSVSGEGTHELFCTATDGADNMGAAPGSSNTGTVMIDTMPPDITITAPAHNSEHLLNLSVASDYLCSDSGSGMATCGGPVPTDSNFDTISVGSQSFTVTATDVAGNETSETTTYTVVYDVTIQSLKKSARQGSAVPIEWTLQDGLGNEIRDLSTLLEMRSVFNGEASGGCVASDEGISQTLYSPATGATGGSSFRLGDGYKFNWDTSTTVDTGKGCYTVLLRLNDDSERITDPVRVR